jgi:hypothetical protein
MNKLSKKLLESSMVTPVMAAMRQFKKNGFDVGYEWDPHNVDDPFVTFYIHDRMDGYMDILKDTLVGWAITDVSEDDDVGVVEAKPPMIEETKV